MDFLNYLSTRWDDVLEDGIEHAEIVLISILIAAVLAVGIGVLVYRNDRATRLALAVTGTFLTIPAFALLGFFVTIPFLGIGAKPVVVALVMYALLPILRNTVVGLRGVDPAISESAKGMGLTNRQVLLRVELPLAWPVIIAGLRVSTVLITGTAAIAAIVGGPGFGDPIFRGLNSIGGRNALNLALMGTLGTIFLALLFDASYQLVGRLTTSRGIR